uniref:SUEL-type lectin domain-containing protein n=1 Tax=Chromera velia CCMP2878 TaxID=1169474 RepID=A0A0G4FUF8_9ALVE|eukprot:Cvel_18702.t1-p1 / transcript=Cvel_18702.t1 / gene=Cvel_18702 / organism=Chromera_velia_CCMP2878 / gene_product=hypothetical protein / transcript_product=hypothetical protein / location=Cvel_scaffold1566:40878-43112(-) / protein_length=590 / sequence_SO=supercontig / SO=protein_coding / is_pseudo=false
MPSLRKVITISCLIGPAALSLASATDRGNPRPQYPGQGGGGARGLQDVAAKVPVALPVSDPDAQRNLRDRPNPRPQYPGSGGGGARGLQGIVESGSCCGWSSNQYSGLTAFDTNGESRRAFQNCRAIVDRNTGQNVCRAGWVLMRGRVTVSCSPIFSTNECGVIRSSSTGRRLGEETETATEQTTEVEEPEAVSNEVLETDAEMEAQSTTVLVDETSERLLQDTIGNPSPGCPLSTRLVNRPTPLCGSFGDSPAWIRGVFRLSILNCPGQPSRVIRTDFVRCDDPTRRLAEESESDHENLPEADDSSATSSSSGSTTSAPERALQSSVVAQLLGNIFGNALSSVVPSPACTAYLTNALQKYNDRTWSANTLRVHIEQTGCASFEEGSGRRLLEEGVAAGDSPAERQLGQDSIGPLPPTSCPLTTRIINKPTPLCGPWDKLPTWKRGDFRQSVVTCPGLPARVIREEFIGCNDPTRLLTEVVPAQTESDTQGTMAETETQPERSGDTTRTGLEVEEASVWISSSPSSPSQGGQLSGRVDQTLKFVEPSSDLMCCLYYGRGGPFTFTTRQGCVNLVGGRVVERDYCRHIVFR